MAPNRKSLSVLVESLSSNDLQNLQNQIQPAFLPLTHPKEQLQHLETQQQPPQQLESASYWDWPAAAEEETVLDISPAAVAVSTRQESHLIAAHDDYWAESSQQSEAETPVVVTKPQHIHNTIESPYWSWPAEQDSNKATIDRILVEEKAYHLVSAATSEMTEITADSPAASRQVDTSKASNDQYWKWNSAEVARHTMDASHPNHNYWDWDANEETQQSPIQALLEYEAVRQMLTAETIVSQMQSQKQLESAACIQESSNDYWAWSEQYGEQYWDFQQPAAIATGKGYWEW